MHSPYGDLPPRAFWRSGVTNRPPLDPGDIFEPRFPVTRKMKIMTAGSCFAQHVGRALREASFDVIDTEPLPAILANAPSKTDFGYGMYSARYGNIYTARQMLQLLREMRGELEPADRVWEKNGRYYDAQRPAVEPDGLESAKAVLEERARHLSAVEEAVKAADLFVFTFGLTEAWVHSETGTVYPTAPGTIAGSYDPDRYSFVNYTAIEVMKDFIEVRKIFRGYNPGCRFLVTVSPVPLTATASGQHVEVATSYSKATLRAVTGMLYDRFRDVEYFPSYELITSANNRGVYFESNKRSVSMKGVATAMETFLKGYGLAPAHAGRAEAPVEGKRPASKDAPRSAEKSDEDVQCEEALLDAFAK